jgi:four helix bundle protein
MAGWKDFRDIVAWQRAREVKLRVDELLKRPAFRRQFKFNDQLSDSARSAPRNIAEGFGRYGNKEFARFARIAKGSELEVLNHLIDAHDQGLISAAELADHEACVNRALAAVVGLIRHLEGNGGVAPGTGE